MKLLKQPASMFKKRVANINTSNNPSRNDVGHGLQLAHSLPTTTTMMSSSHQGGGCLGRRRTRCLRGCGRRLRCDCRHQAFRTRPNGATHVEPVGSESGVWKWWSNPAERPWPRSRHTGHARHHARHHSRRHAGSCRKHTRGPHTRRRRHLRLHRHRRRGRRSRRTWRHALSQSRKRLTDQ